MPGGGGAAARGAERGGGAADPRRGIFTGFRITQVSYEFSDVKMAAMLS